MSKTKRSSALLLGLIALTLIAAQATAANSTANKGTPFQEIWDYITSHTETQEAEMQSLRDEIATLTAETHALRDQVTALEARVAELEGGGQPPQPQSMTVYIDDTPLDPRIPQETSAGEHVFTAEFANPAEGAYVTWDLYNFGASEPLASGEGLSFTQTLQQNHAYRLHVQAYLMDATYYDYDNILWAK